MEEVISSAATTATERNQTIRVLAADTLAKQGDSPSGEAYQHGKQIIVHETYPVQTYRPRSQV